MQQEQRLAPATWLNPNQMDTDPELLGLLDADSKVLVSGNEDRVADRPISGKCDHIGDNQRIHPLLFAYAIHEAEADFDILQMSERKVLWRRTGGRPVVPIDPKKWHSGNRGGKIAKCLDGSLVCETNFRSREPSSREKQRALGKYVTCIHENRDSVHSP